MSQLSAPPPPEIVLCLFWFFFMIEYKFIIITVWIKWRLKTLTIQLLYIFLHNQLKM